MEPIGISIQILTPSRSVLRFWEYAKENKLKPQKKYLRTKKPLIWYLPKLIWVFIFLTTGLMFLTLGNKLFSNELGQVLLTAFILSLLIWSKGAFNRYKLWKNWMQENDKSIKWKSWFRF